MEGRLTLYDWRGFISEFRLRLSRLERLDEKVAANMVLEKLSGGLRKTVLSKVKRNHLVKVTGLEGPGMSTALVEALVARTIGHMPTKVKAQADGYLIYLSDKDSSQRLSSMTVCAY